MAIVLSRARNAARLAGVLCSGLIAQSARGLCQPLPQQSEARLLSADPNSYVFAFFWRGSVRGKIGGRIPFLGNPARPGLHVDLPALIELMNSNDILIPNQLWRGRVALEVYERIPVSWAGHDAALSFGGALEHESDHVTAPRFGGYIYSNDLALRTDFTLSLGIHSVTASVLSRVHVFTCTVDESVCAADRPPGDPSFESAAEIVFDGGFGPRAPGRPGFFFSVFASWLLANGLVAQQRRLVADAGLSLRPSDVGLFQIYGTLLLGNDLGLLYQRDSIEAGVGFRWAP